jgi:hypothetical protein
VTFGNPWFLLGALAALIPLLVHLFDRRRPRPHPFGAIAFVLRSQRRTASRLKLRRLLLYTLRTLLLLAIPLALARPEWRREVDPAAESRGPTATAIVLDASLSMRFSDGESLFARGQEQAREALRELSAEEPATFFPCTLSPSPPPTPGFDRARLRAQVDAAQPTFLPAELNRCLELAARALEESPLPGKRLLVISDFTVPALRLDLPAPVVKGPEGQAVRPEVVLRDVAAGKKALPNRALVDLRVEPAVQAGPRAFQFTFTVRNFSPTPAKDLEATLRLGDRAVAKAFLELSPNGTAQKTLVHRFEEGGAFAGEIALAEDGLAEDDRRPFAVHVPKALRALVINGAPHAVRHLDEAFFLDAALGAPGSPIEHALRDTGAGFREELDGYDVVFLLNAAAPPPEFAARLGAFVERGGGLFLSMGDRVDPDAWNAALGPLLPRRLRLVKTAAERSGPEAEAKASRLAQVALEHAVFTPFAGEAGEGLTSSRVFRYMLLEAEAAATEGSQVLASAEDGAPLLAVARRGKGRVMLFTSTLDRDWADLAIRTSFLPLMQRISSFLAGSLEERDELRTRVGGKVTLRVEPPRKVEGVRGPDGSAVPVEPQPDGTVVAGPAELPGVYQVVDQQGAPIPSLTFAALLDPAESDLSRLQGEALSAWFGEASVTRASSGGAQAPKTPLWTWLILAGALAFVLEGVLLRR